MMLLIGTTMAALVLCAARALWTLWTQEEQTENVQGINHLQDLTIAPKRGRKYHRTTCPHTRANSDSKEFSACSLCFPEYMYKETVVRKESCRFTAAVMTLLCGAILGSLATFCGMMMIPGTGEERQALDNYRNNKLEEELALGEVQASKEVTKEKKRRRKRRQEQDESDENELMATWVSRSGKPNTHYEHYEFYLRNYNVCTVNADEINVNTIRNRNAYTIKDYMEIGKVMLPYALLCANHMLSEFYDVFGVFSEYYKEETRNGTQNTENQESESLEPGYAPRYLVKQRVKELVHRQGEVLNEFVQEKLATVGEKFHDVVHEIISKQVVFQGIRVAVFLGTPVGLITWIILAYFSSVFLREVTRSTRRRRKTRGERKAQATSRKQCKSLLLAALVYSNLETAKGMEDALCIEETHRDQCTDTTRNTNLSRGDQDISSSQQPERDRTYTSISGHNCISATTADTGTASTGRCTDECSHNV